MLSNGEKGMDKLENKSISHPW